MKSIFQTALVQGNADAGSVTSQIFESARQYAANAGNRIVGEDTTRAALAMEAFSPQTQNDLNTQVRALKTEVQRWATSANLSRGGSEVKSKGLGNMRSYTLAQESAAVVSAVLASSPQSALRNGTSSAASLRAKYANNPYVEVVGHEGLEGAMESFKLPDGRMALEAYDNAKNTTAVAYAITYHMQAARQEEFAEALYPTVTVTPDNVGYAVTVTLNLLEDEVRRPLTGVVSSFGRRNVLEAVTDPTLLRNDQTRAIPIVRTGGANDSTAFFTAAADVTPSTVVQDKVNVTTAPLKPGVAADLLALSQQDLMLQAGQNDQTDALDPALTLTAIYIKTTVAVGVTKVIKVDTSAMAGADLNAAVQGGGRQSSLNLITSDVLVTQTTTDYASAAIAQFSAIGTNRVRLGFQAFGNVILDTASCTMNFTPVTVATVTDATGVQLSTASGAGATIAALFADATIVGYDMKAFRTNSNKRQRGQLVNTQTQSRMYTVPYLPPITSLRPVGETDANDNAVIEGLITLTRIRTTQAAITELFAAYNRLKSSFSPTDTLTSQPKLSATSYLVKNYLLEAALDVAVDIASLTSTDRPENLTSVVINLLRDMVYNLWNKSALQPASSAYAGGAAPAKPLVIIATDPTVHRYLTLVGDTRMLGDGFDFKIVSTIDPRMAGKIFLSFGVEEAYGSGAPHPFHFGSMAWAPEVPVMMPMTRNGAISYELTVAPRFRHVTQLYVMGYVTITNITEAISTKIAINTNQV